MRIGKEICIEMGHRLQHHAGKCRNLHGHSYRIQIMVEGSIVTEGVEKGMIMDYARLKKAIAKIDEIFDHKMVLEYTDPLLRRLLPDIQQSSLNSEWSKDYLSVYSGSETDPLVQQFVLLKMPPTAENLACLWLKMISTHFDNFIYKFSIKVWETATSFAEIS